jgi:steroid delta-isomerase-like uncharacterized protein
MGEDAVPFSPEGVAVDALAKWYAAWNAHDVDATSQLMTDDVLYEDPSAPELIMHGRAKVEIYMRSAFRGFPDLHLEKLEEWVTPGGAVIASYFRVTATLNGPLAFPGRPTVAPTGGRIEALGMDRSEIRDGLVARHQIFWDLAEVGRQMGLVPMRGTVGERVGYRLQNLAARRKRSRAA